MRTILLSLVCLTALAQSPPATPQNLRLVPNSAAAVGDIIPVPVLATNGQFLAVWYSPSYILRTNSYIIAQPIANIWIPESSTDGVVWKPANDLVYLPPREIRTPPQPCLNCLHFTEVFSVADQVRIRLVSY